MNKRSAWIEINLDNLRHNVRLVRKAVGPDVKIMGILKADAYGHGCSAVSEVLVQEGVDQFALATLPEALMLRKKFSNIPILVLGTSPILAAHEIIVNQIDQAVQDLDYAKKLNAYAKSIGKKARVHIKVDTGMSRYGFIADKKGIEDIAAVFELTNLEVAGIFSHFSSSSSDDEGPYLKQKRRFESLLGELKSRNISLPTVHMANSGAIFRHPDAHYDMVRMGIVMFGLSPSDHPDYKKIDLRPVMSLKASVVRLRKIKKGETVGYSERYTLSEDEKIATVPIGYADGLTANIAEDYRVLFKGGRYKLAGSVCMDAAMIALPKDVEVEEGDVITFFGEEDGTRLSMDELAKAMGIMSYELMCRFKLRLKKFYISGGLIHEDKE